MTERCGLRPDHPGQVFPHMLRTELGSGALDPATARLDDRDLVALLRRAAALAPLLRYTHADHEEGPEGRDDWRPLVRSNVVFLLAEMASVDAVQEYFDGRAEAGRALEATLARLARWQAWASELAQGAASDTGNRTRLPGPASSIESELLTTGLRIGMEELQHGTTPRERFSAANRATRLLSDLAKAYLTRALSDKTDHQAHLALLLVFVQLLREEKAHLNGLLERHLGFHFGDLLRLAPRPAGADEAYVCFRLAPQARPLTLAAGRRLLAGASRGIAFSLQEDLTVTQTRIDACRALYVERDPTAVWSTVPPILGVLAIRAAASADGLGAPLAAGDGWPLFGNYEPAEVEWSKIRGAAGLVITSPLLVLSGGTRRIRVTLTLSQEGEPAPREVLQEFQRYVAGEMEGEVDEHVFARVLENMFEVSVSGPGGYAPVRDARARVDRESGALIVEAALTAADPPVTRAEPSGDSTVAPGPWPSLRLRVNRAARVQGYGWLAQVALARVELSVSVRGLQSLQLHGPQGPCEEGKPFPPFGIMPRPGAALSFGHDELRDKPLRSARFHLEWANLPKSAPAFARSYAPYGLGMSLDGFRAEFRALRGSSWTALLTRPSGSSVPVPRFPCFPGPPEGALPPHAEWNLEVNGLEFSGGHARVFQLRLTDPEHGFAHDVHPTLIAELGSRWWPGARRRLRAVLRQPPWTPIAARAWLDYDATASFSPREPGPTRHAIYQLTPFDDLLAMPPDGRVVPEFDRHGYLYLGLTGARVPETLSLYFELRNPTTDAGTSRGSGAGQLTGHLRWRYFGPEGWTRFPTHAIRSDTTHDLTHTGLVRLDLPEDMVDWAWRADEPKRLWVEVSTDADPSDYGRVLTLRPQGALVTRVLETPGGTEVQALPSQSITRLAEPEPSIARIEQPHPTRGGRPPEETGAFRRRVSERLRHKGRAILPRDFESIVLDAFPTIREVCCLGVGRRRVMVVVVPEHPADGTPVHPEVPPAVCRLIEEHLAARCSRSIRKVLVRSPWYEPVRVSASLMLDPERRADRFKAREVLQVLDRWLAPWRFDPALRMQIGTGRFTEADLRSHLDHHCRDLGVARIGALSIVHHFRHPDEKLLPGAHDLDDSARLEPDRAHLEVATPWSVFIPSRRHRLYLEPDPPGIGAAQIREALQVATPSASKDRRALLPLAQPVRVGVGSLRVGEGLILPKRPRRADDPPSPDPTDL